MPPFIPSGEYPLPAGLAECVAEFLATDHTREPGRDFYPETLDTAWFFPLQRPQEMARMIQVARAIKPRVVYEIGADKGSGVYHWCKCLPSVERVIACEIRGTPYGAAFEKAFPNIDFLWLPESSYAAKTVDRVLQWLDGDLIDVLFIDGDKRNFVTDFDVHWPLLNPKGVVFMHDVCDRPVQAAWAAINARGYRTEHIVDRSEGLAAVARAKRGEPAATHYEEWLRHWGGQSCTVGVIHLGG